MSHSIFYEGTIVITNINMSYKINFTKARKKSYNSTAAAFK